jgi:hypothetical protein
MANTEGSSNTPETRASQEDANARRSDNTRDPEFEIPNPEQVEQDIKQAEETYGKQQQPAAGKDDKVA